MVVVRLRDWDAQQCSQEPVARRDALPEDDLVFFLLDLVPQIDLSPFHQYYAQELRGQPPFDVTMMVTLLVYAYSVGVCSSRRVAAACERNLAFRAVVGDDPLTSAQQRFPQDPPGGVSAPVPRGAAWLARWVWSSLETCPPTGRRWERTPRGTRR